LIRDPVIRGCATFGIESGVGVDPTGSEVGVAVSVGIEVVGGGRGVFGGRVGVIGVAVSVGIEVVGGGRGVFGGRVGVIGVAVSVGIAGTGVDVGSIIYTKSHC